MRNGMEVTVANVAVPTSVSAAFLNGLMRRSVSIGMIANDI